MTLPTDILTPLLSRPRLVVEVGGGASFDVREFAVTEGLSTLFQVDLVCVSPDSDIDFEAVVGTAARFAIERGIGGQPVGGQSRVFRGVVQSIAQLEPEEMGLATYRIIIVPALWLLSQNRTYRIFQDTSDPQIALRILQSWGLDPDVRLSDGYKARRYRVQYAESDFAFASRMLEDAGVTYYFDTSIDGDGGLVVHDAPGTNEPRAPLPFISKPTSLLSHDFVTDLELHRHVKPGRYTQEDLDYRKPPTFPVRTDASGGLDLEQSLEVYHYNPGSLLFAGGGSGTPVADDNGAQRTDLAEGGKQTRKRLDAKRGSVKRCLFRTSAIDIRPGNVVSFTDHPRADLGAGKSFLVVASSLHGTSTGDWHHRCEAQPLEARFRPPLSTPKPRANGVESATVVGPSGDEIHTDEFGRVRVHFHWDREGSFDESASCWIPVNQPWAGTSFGALNIPRIGQETLVDFLGADPDRPVIMGRVFTETNPPPYELPKYHDLQGIRSESTPKLPAGVPRSGMLLGKTAGGGDGAGSAGPQSSPTGGGMPFSIDQIAQILSGSRFFKALSADATTHQWQGSELTMQDPQGEERVYMQAQKNFHKVVKNNQTTVVAHSKNEKIGTDNIRFVSNKESFKVGSDRTGLVNGLQREVVQTVALRQSVTAGQQFEATEFFASRAKDHKFVSKETWGSEAPVQIVFSKEMLKMVCGSSIIIMKPEGIVVQGALTHLVPGDALVKRALQGADMALADRMAKADATREAERKKAAAYADAFAQTVADMQYQPKPGANSGGAQEGAFRRQFGKNLTDAGYPPDGTTNGIYNDLVNGTHTIPPAPTYSTPIGPATDI